MGEWGIDGLPLARLADVLRRHAPLILAQQHRAHVKAVSVHLAVDLAHRGRHLQLKLPDTRADLQPAGKVAVRLDKIRKQVEAVHVEVEVAVVTHGLAHPEGRQHLCFALVRLVGGEVDDVVHGRVGDHRGAGAPEKVRCERRVDKSRIVQDELRREGLDVGQECADLQELGLGEEEHVVVYRLVGRVLVLEGRDGLREVQLVLLEAGDVRGLAGDTRGFRHHVAHIVLVVRAVEVEPQLMAPRQQLARQSERGVQVPHRVAQVDCHLHRGWLLGCACARVCVCACNREESTRVLTE
mmetsp:Transcript_6265/g.16155  ORF Transcript_6265/g.16155 Transcript_6265/m.16155 type:complete len:297 (+) Transcript_6265:875-1765(+)